MPSSNRGMLGRGNGTITVIEEPVMRSYRRKAKIVFYLTAVITGALGATVAASKWHPVIALGVGLVLALITGTIVGAVVAAWPIIRALWWWTPETVIGGSVIYGWIELAEHTTLFYRLAVMAVSPHPDQPGHVVPSHPAPHAHLLFGIHHRQPHRQPAADLVGTPHPGRGTRVDLAAPRPVAG